MKTAPAQAESGVIVPHPLSWQRRLAATVIVGLARVCIATWRRHWRDADKCPVTPGPAIFCIWHNRMVLALATWDIFFKEHWPTKGIAAMISASRDGGLLVEIVSKFGVNAIRGSSSRRGPQALLEATSWIERDYSVVLTPDGPRGPVYQVQDGIISLAALTGCPIIPMSSYSHPKLQLKSWDRLQIPLPFADCVMRYGKPMRVPRDASPELREQLRLELQAAMMEITID